jgi:hypothetical protein
VELRPDFSDAHYNLGLALLQTGDFAEGWLEYEWRFRRTGGTNPLRHQEIPRWEGESPAHKTILLYAEQGYGDALQCIRYVPLFARAGARVVVECRRELHSLFSVIEGVHEVVAPGDPLPLCEMQSPLFSLPRLFNTRLETIPVAMPYLQAGPSAVCRWRNVLRPASALLHVGLVWEGNPEHANDHQRSISREFFRNLSLPPGILFHSLDPHGVESEFPLPVMDHAAHLTDFKETAALITNLDLVITVDTAVAHLAGALAKPVWVLLPFAADWRWLQNRSDSPWYPTMRLIRQPAQGRWDAVLTEVEQALASLIREQRHE